MEESAGTKAANGGRDVARAGQLHLLVGTREEEIRVSERQNSATGTKQLLGFKKKKKRTLKVV